MAGIAAIWAFKRQRNIYGDSLALLLQLHITYADGRSEVISSDEQWKAATGPIRMNDIYMGETMTPGWSRPAGPGRILTTAHGTGVRKLEHRKDIVVAQTGAGCARGTRRSRPARIFQSPKGETMLDFGQNMVGWVRLRVRGPAGTTITLRHAEVLDQHGNFYTENLRSAKQIIRYTLKGDRRRSLSSRALPFMGFQFIAVKGFPGAANTRQLHRRGGAFGHAADWQL